MEIKKGSADFKYGFSDPNQLDEFLKENQNINGVAFLGRSNVGKSSLINSLFGNKTARVSKTPGRTREINTFEFVLTGDPEEEIFYLFDLPGYGFAEVNNEMSKNWEVLMSTFFGNINKRIKILNIQDARHPDQKVDREFHDFLSGFDLNVLLAFNKIDKLKKQKDRAILEKQKPKLFSNYKHIKEIHFVSAENKKGLPKLEQALISDLTTAD